MIVIAECFKEFGVHHGRRMNGDRNVQKFRGTLPKFEDDKRACQSLLIGRMVLHSLSGLVRMISDFHNAVISWNWKETIVCVPNCGIL
jgi:hypothetical protein